MIEIGTDFALYRALSENNFSNTNLKTLVAILKKRGGGTLIIDRQTDIFECKLVWYFLFA